MLKSPWGGFSFILYVVFTISLTASADVGSEVYVVSSNIFADAHYMSSNGDGTFSAQEILHLGSDPNFQVFLNRSYANGLGDFDGDGDQDYIMITGYFSKHIYISEKADDANQFAGPYFAGTLGAAGGQTAYDFAVADFNEDGFDDFVLSLGSPTFSGLYIGDGNFGFNSELVYHTAESASTGADEADSSGADAADFNGDGHADFVIAPDSAGQFFVSLGDGGGNFTTSSFNTCDGCGGGRGIAAADFTGDGIADIAVADFDHLDLYVGAGDGINFTYHDFTDDDSHALPPDSSAIDNYDFDGNGTQDLVVASPAGVAVLLGRGDGTFDNATYFGGIDYDRNAVSAPPWVPQPAENIAPVAVIEPAYLEATVGEEIVFDGSNSFDEDGRIVSYEWDFGDDGPSADVPGIALMSLAAADPKVEGVNPAYAYQDSGSYVVTLWVTDDKGSTSSVAAEIAVFAKPYPIISAKAKFSLDKHYFNGQKEDKSKKANYIKAKIEFPEEYDARYVDPSSVYIVAGKEAVIFSHVKKKSNFWDEINKKYSKRKKSISVKFDQQAVLATLECPPAKETMLTVRGEILDNSDSPPKEFEATGVIRLKMEKKSSCNAD